MCEWRRCRAECDTHELLVKHGAKHLDECDSVGQLECNWDLCMFKASERLELHRHIDFHFYHTHLKAFGERLLIGKSMPNCRLESRRRNIFPDSVCAKEYTCQWLDCAYHHFNGIWSFFQHMHQHCAFETAMKLQSSKIPCDWKGCGKLFAQQKVLKEHLRMHTHERVTACPQCGSIFMSYQKFYAHFQRQADNSWVIC